MTGWITTWKAIARYIDRTEKTAKKYHKLFGLPVRRLPGNLPAILPNEVDTWLITFDEIKKREKKKNL